MKAVGLKKCFECFQLAAQAAFPERNPYFRVRDLHFQARKIDEHDLA